GTQPVLHEGPARSVLRAVLLAADATHILETPLPGLLLPNQEMSAAVRLPVPAQPGNYDVTVSLTGTGTFVEFGAKSQAVAVQLNVAEAATQQQAISTQYPTGDGCCATSLGSVHASLAQAASKQSLPD